MTNTPLHETQTLIENHALRAQPIDSSIIFKPEITNEPVVTVTIYCKHWLRCFSGCVPWGNESKTVLCFFAKMLVLKHEAKESKVRSRPSLSLFFWH